MHRRCAFAFAASALFLGAHAGCEGHAEPRAEDASRRNAGSLVQPKPNAAAPGTNRTAKAGAVPVVVELFSSEGCSSCPPADRVLEDLASTQGIDGAEVIALEMHVDYWNDLGWTDPFSDAKFSDRQRSYARVGARQGVFTPEAIIDGTSSVIGSDRSLLSSAISRATDRPHTPVVLRMKDSGLDAELGPIDGRASLWIAVTESGLETAVPSGENGGKTLRHAPIVRSLERIGGAREGTTAVPIPAIRAQRGPLAAVVFVQRDDDRAIVGAGVIDLAPR